MRRPSSTPVPSLCPRYPRTHPHGIKTCVYKCARSYFFGNIKPVPRFNRREDIVFTDPNTNQVKCLKSALSNEPAIEIVLAGTRTLGTMDGHNGVCEFNFSANRNLHRRSFIVHC